MSELQWRGGINHILYVIMYTQRLDDAEVSRVADLMIEGRVLTAGPQLYLDAINTGLASGEPLIGGIDTPHSDDEVRDFVSRLAAHLERLRPWPGPKLTKLDINAWPTLGDAKPIAKIELTRTQVRDRIPAEFDALSAETNAPRGLLLRLRSGAVLGLLAPVEARTPGVVMLLRDGDPGAVIDEFLSYTRVQPEHIRRL